MGLDLLRAEKGRRVRPAAATATGSVRTSEHKEKRVY